MSWKKYCLEALDEEKMFENAMHRSRFKELFDCYKNYPFFTKGLCKCIYLSAWDDEHFCIMVEMLNELSLGHEEDTTEMSNKGDSLLEEQTGDDYYVFQLSIALLNDLSFHLPENVSLSPDTRYLIRRALQTSEIIDQL